MIATLPMYDFPETRAAHDAFWTLVRDGLRDSGRDAPESLDRDGPFDAAWGAPDLVLSHICNLPYRKSFRDAVTRIGASDYGFEGCAPGYYRSVYIVNESSTVEAPEQLRNVTMAINSPDSQSGWCAFAVSRPIEDLPDVVVTGSHAASIQAVAEGRAAFATIDAQSFAVLADILPDAKRVRVVGTTSESPGMTFITRKGEDAGLYLDVLNTALDALSDEHRPRLGLKSVVALEDDAYDLPLPPAPLVKAA